MKKVSTAYSAYAMCTGFQTIARKCDPVLFMLMLGLRCEDHHVGDSAVLTILRPLP